MAAARRALRATATDDPRYDDKEAFMRALFLLPLLAAIPAAAPAQPAPRTVNVQLSSFDFTPSDIRLRAGEPIVLRLTNSGNGGHNFSAPQFFRAATIAPGQSVAINGGAIEVRGHQTVSLRLTPTRGNYRLRCTHTLHTAFGMKGRITVE
jgi:plastocyanin